MNSYEYQKLRGLKRKIELIKKRGGCCEVCGYDKNLAAFDFHHKDPNQKESKLDMRHLSNSTMKSILQEFDKCQVLCANCHRELHSPDLDFFLVEELVKTIDNDVVEVKSIGKPKCLDCGNEISYGYKRCKTCNGNQKKTKLPSLDVLIDEKIKNGVKWCASKYNCSEKTIRKWLSKQN